MTQTVQPIDFSAGRKAIRERPQRALAAQAVAISLFETEHAVDAAAGEMSKLFSTIIEQRRSAGLSTTVGQSLLADVTEAQAGIVSALDRLTAAHRKAQDLTRELGLPRMDFGDGGAKPDS